MADRENARLTKAQFYWRAVPTFLLMMVWTGVWGLFAGMTGGFGDIGHGYLPTLFLIHGFCIECFELSVLLMMVWTGVWGLFAGMTGGFGDIGHGYLPALFLIHGFCIEC